MELTGIGKNAWKRIGKKEGCFCCGQQMQRARVDWPQRRVSKGQCSTVILAEPPKSRKSGNF